MAVRRPYVRSMDGWWKRDPFFIKYMAREITAFIVAIYAVVLLAGLARLSQGPEAFEQWLDGLRSPGSIAFHVFVLLVFLYHTWSWFRIMPKTMPPVNIGSRRLTPGAITGLGLAASGVLSVAMYLLFWGLAR